ncbi:MAG: hypothetical protein KDB80_06935 [Planctomycetes bacterium]|nr:hypothetical protein [Planctomycetota bacterium]
MVRLHLRCAVAALLLPMGLAAQFVTTDADKATTLPVTIIGSNGTYNGAAAYFVTDEQVWTDGTFQVQNGTSGRCDLVIDNGGTLRIEDSSLQVRGNIWFREGGTLQLIRTDCTLRNSYPRQYNYEWEGGHLYTKRCTIGGYDNGSSQITNFWLNRGFWTLRDTVVQHSGGILLGYLGHLPGMQGGSLDADGLVAGIASDAVVMLGRGDATVRNSRFPIKMDLYATQGGTVDLDLQHDTTIDHRVYGDANVHDTFYNAPVTAHIPGSPWRLELVNTSVVDWAVAINEVRPNNPALDIRLHNASKVNLRVMGHDLTGSPTLSGPWRSYYPAPMPLPGLPASQAPGEHGIPPGCSITIGNATFSAPSNQWAYPTDWAFNFWGDSTNFTISGSMRIGELFMDDAARVTLQGSGEYNAGILAQTFDINGLANLTIRNATIGNAGSGFQAAITSYGRASVTLDNVTTQSVLLRTARGLWWPHQGVNLATIDMSNYLEEGDLGLQSAHSGSITIHDASTTQNTDLQNLDFEGAVQGGRPDYWAVSNVSGYQSATHRAGASSFTYASNSGSGSMRKRLTIPPETDVEFDGWIQLTTATSGATVKAFVQGSSGNRREVTPMLVVGSWAYFCTGAYVVRSNDTWVELGVEHAGGSAYHEMRCDAFQVRTSSWWEDDNLGNLAFEDDRIGEIPGLDESGNGPNHWHNWRTFAQIETNDLRPGTSGSRAMRISTLTLSSQLHKRLSFIEPGQTIRFRGWVKPLNGTADPVKVIVSEYDSNWWDLNYGNNAGVVLSGSTWQSFDLTYVVPGGSLKADETSLTVSSNGAYLIDDFSVEIQ